MSSAGRINRTGEGFLTDGSYDLSLHAKLILEPTSEVAYATVAITRNIGNLPYMIEHLAAGEEEDNNEADSSPKISTLNHWKDVG